MHRALPPPEPFLTMRDDTVCGAAQLTLPLRGPSLSPLKGGEGLFCDQLQLSDMDVLQPSPIPVQPCALRKREFLANAPKLRFEPDAYATGLMFWLSRNKLVGSYLFFSAWSLWYFSGP